jgi:hypothetical protein
MTCPPARALPLFLCSLWLLALPAAAGDARTALSPGDKVPLEDADLRSITLRVLETHPLLAASPGIKHAEAWRNPTTDSAMIVFHPHSETAGIKTAYQAHCNRDIPNGAWACPADVIRRYVKLESQDFEVRVRGAIDLQGVLALIEANGGYHVAWGNRDGMGQVSVEAFLREDGNPANPDDWKVRLYQPEP